MTPSTTIARPGQRTVSGVGAPSPRRTPTVETVPLPADTRRALSGIVAQLRDVPRNLIGDPAEVVHFLGRTARALERLRDAPVPVVMSQISAPAEGRNPVRNMSGNITGPAPRTLSALERAEAVFQPTPASAGKPTPIVLPARRLVLTRKGRRVPVEVRRARAAGQMEFGL